MFLGQNQLHCPEGHEIWRYGSRMKYKYRLPGPLSFQPHHCNLYISYLILNYILEQRKIIPPYYSPIKSYMIIIHYTYDVLYTVAVSPLREHDLPHGNWQASTLPKLTSLQGLICFEGDCQPGSAHLSDFLAQLSQVGKLWKRASKQASSIFLQNVA